MAERDNPVTVYLTDGEKADLEQWADESGKSVSELSRQAIREYTDRDRFERIEDNYDLSILYVGHRIPSGLNPKTVHRIQKGQFVS